MHCPVSEISHHVQCTPAGVQGALAGSCTAPAISEPDAGTRLQEGDAACRILTVPSECAHSHLHKPCSAVPKSLHPSQTHSYVPSCQP